MFGFLGIILILVLFVVLFVIAILGSFIRTIFGLGKRATQAFTGEKTSVKFSLLALHHIPSSLLIIFSSVQSLSCVRLFATP